jgi:histidyl-tRNA synthetase
MVFEIDVPKLGAEKQVCGGGAYVLTEMFGLEPLTSTGFAIGFDRVLLALEKQGTELPGKQLTAYIIPMGDEALESALNLTYKLRENNISTDISLAKRNISKEMKRADALNVKFTLIIGEDELKKGTVKVKDMGSGEQKEIVYEKVLDFFKM